MSTEQLAAGNEFGLMLCEALGIETSRVSRVLIDVRAGEGAAITVVREVLVTVGNMEDIRTHIENFTIMSNDGEGGSKVKNRTI